MNLEEKQGVVEVLAEKMRTANAFYLTDFTGLNVKRMTRLRARLREQGLEYLVVKNTLAERALADLEFPDLAAFFRGPTGLVIGRDDPILAARVLADFAKDNDDRPSVKAAMVDRRTVTAEEVSRLAKLPTREQLLAMLAGALESPMSQLAGALEAKLQEVAGLLEALREQRAA